MKRILLLLFFSSCLTTPLLAQLRIYRIAGDSMGIPGFTGDNGPAIASRLNMPGSVATDALGNVYIADTGNHRIRMILRSTGLIQSIAGGGTSQPGEGDTATHVDLDLNFIAADKTGNIYLTENSRHVVRKIDAQTKIITTIAGTYGASGFGGDSAAATAATLLLPGNLCLDEMRNFLYVCDVGNHRIRKVDLNTGIISTIAGNGIQGYAGDNSLAVNAELDNPMAVASDSTGNLYISDANDRIRKIDHSTGIITLFAGTSPGYGGDHGPASAASFHQLTSLSCDKKSKILYLADYGNTMIRKIDLLTDTVQQVAGSYNSWDAGGDGGSAESAILAPTGITVGANGHVYAVDDYNNQAREIKNPVDWPYHHFPDSNAVWNFSYDNFNACTGADYFSIAITGDTLINGKVYHKLYTPYVSVTTATYCIPPTAGYKGAVHDDTIARKVFFVPPSGSAEYVLYDFTMQVGDTVKGYLASYLGGQSSDVVHSMDSVLVGGTYRKRWLINYSYNIQLIEGLGSNYGLVVPSLGELADGGHYYLDCFIQEDLAAYPYPGINCQLITSIASKESKISGLFFFPNPANDVLHIKDGETIINLRICDVLGNEAINISGYTTSINISTLRNGIYFIHCESNKGTFTGKFIKN